MMIQITEIILVIKMILEITTMMTMFTRQDNGEYKGKENTMAMTLTMIQDCRDNIGD